MLENNNGKIKFVFKGQLMKFYLDAFLSKSYSAFLPSIVDVGLWQLCRLQSFAQVLQENV